MVSRYCVFKTPTSSGLYRHCENHQKPIISGGFSHVFLPRPPSLFPVLRVACGGYKVDPPETANEVFLKFPPPFTLQSLWFRPAQHMVARTATTKTETFLFTSTFISLLYALVNVSIMSPVRVLACSSAVTAAACILFTHA